ncbi:MAG TPA: AbrB/MazE/SpoVT family DNA-binding domain-containing protein [Thermoanaerobaculia bacterium]|nr:AbrB/MazE/SpoVT family DNA-binding domain-containing protein [Thermoanaerobaculia bacterium]
MKPKPPKPAAITVRISTKGQLVVPKEVRLRHGWSAGAELTLEDFGDRVVLREVREFPETRLEELIGCTGYRGPAKTLQDMDDGVAEGARRHRER